MRLNQRRFEKALEAYEEARERFTRLDEPGSVAVVWHQTGIALAMTGKPEAAEEAYRKSLAIKVALGDVAGQADTLNQLANLYDDILDRPEDAVTFYRQAADSYVASQDQAKEGVTRSNLAVTLHKLGRFDEARQEAERALACKTPFGHTAEPWKTWALLAKIEADAGEPAPAAEAKRKAVACYVTYRRDGGENHSVSGRIIHAITQSLLTGDTASAASLLQQLAVDPKMARLRRFLQALRAIVGGSRDLALADMPELEHTMSAEILFLIETLQQRSV